MEILYGLLPSLLVLLIGSVVAYRFNKAVGDQQREVSLAIAQQQKEVSLAIAAQQKEVNLAIADRQEEWSRKERAAEAARYLAVTSQLTKHDTKEVYREANALSWQLAMWLPADLYRDVRDAIATPGSTMKEVFAATIAIRKLLLGEEGAGDLGELDIALHKPGIGESQ